MIPAAFEYERAESIDHAIELLGRHGDEAKLLAGGHSLIPMMKLRLATPSTLVDIGRLNDLKFVRPDGDHVSIGALTPHDDIEHSPVLAQHCPILAHTAGEVGDRQVRYLGTIGGSVAHGDPASDLPTVLLALDAEFVVHSGSGDRTVAAKDFFKGLFETDLGPTEMLTEIRVPKLSGGWSYQKFHHRAQDWAIVGVAAVASNGGHHVALTNMGETPLRAEAVEQSLSSGSDAATAAREAAQGTSPPSDPFGSADYRRALAVTLTRRALQEALAG
ncbi:MAG: xanthine dehydrogenase family protein subunit M [Actinomycetota bacterium]|nr:xanthine dehydrogenase family protein subunit M [Actinomycetota bacterium]